jgi:hypothetical protein
MLSGQKANGRASNALSRKGWCRVRKKLTILTLVGLALVLVSSPVLAAGSSRDTYLAAKQGPKRKAHVISMTGTIQWAGNGTISVTVQMTNKPFVVKRGQTVLVKTTSNTVYYFWSGKNRRRASFGDLVGGQKVSINALVTTTAITARRVEVNKPRYP